MRVAANCGSFIHQLAQYPTQLLALATRSRCDRERNRDLIFRIADHMPAVAKPFFDLVPGSAVFVDPAGLVLAPVRIRIGGLAIGFIHTTRRMAFHRFAIVAQIAPEIRQFIHQLTAHFFQHCAQHTGFMFHS